MLKTKFYHFYGVFEHEVEGKDVWTDTDKDEKAVVVALHLVFLPLEHRSLIFLQSKRELGVDFLHSLESVQVEDTYLSVCKEGDPEQVWYDDFDVMASLLFFLKKIRNLASDPLFFDNRSVWRVLSTNEAPILFFVQDIYPRLVLWLIFAVGEQTIVNPGMNAHYLVGMKEYSVSPDIFRGKDEELLTSDNENGLFRDSDMVGEDVHLNLNPVVALQRPNVEFYLFQCCLPLQEVESFFAAVVVDNSCWRMGL